MGGPRKLTHERPPHRSKPMADSRAIDARPDPGWSSRNPAFGARAEPGLTSSSQASEIDDRLRAAPRGVRDNSDQGRQQVVAKKKARSVSCGPWKNPAITYFRAYALSSAATA